MDDIQVQGIHHITLNGADRETSIEFWNGVLGMRFIAEQPNLDRPDENHLYFDPGDGRMITVFTDEGRVARKSAHPSIAGSMHHLALMVSQATFRQLATRLTEKGIAHSGPKDRGFMDSIYFRDPLGTLIELASYNFVPPFGFSEGDVLAKAHELRMARGAPHVTQAIVADALAALTRSKD